jgi:hypothetical protein
MRNRGSWSIFVGVVGLAFVFLICAHLAFSRAYLCADTSSDIWPGYLRCLKASEVGDVFSGLFAPAAFLVLAATLILQVLQLKSQAEDLSATRAVMIKQVEQIETQNIILQKQTDLLMPQEERSRIDALLNQLADAIRATLATTNFLMIWRDGRLERRPAFPDATAIPENRDFLLTQFSLYMWQAGVGACEIDHSYTHTVEQVYQLSKNVGEEISGMSAPLNLQEPILGLDRMSLALYVALDPKGRANPHSIP